MTFNLELSINEIILLSAMALITLYLTTVYRRRITRVIRQKALLEAAAVEIEPENLPPLSVIIYTRDNAEDLNRMLPDVLGQDYPSGLEVIVVNDGSSEATKDVVNRLAMEHRNLRLTFIPDEAHNLSRRKLGITLGIKAARNDAVVITAAEAIIPSDRWLRSIGHHFAGGKSVVIGHAVMNHNCDCRPLHAFDETVNTATYLGAVCGHRPYRGNSFNIAYDKKLFFNNKGFARSLNLHGGDDDIFINEITTPGNCVAELTNNGTIRLNYSNITRAYREQKLSHLFTSRFLPHGERRMAASGFWCLWLSIAITASLTVLSLPDMTAVTAAVVMLAAQLTTLTIAWRKVATALSVKLSSGKIPLMMFVMPWHNIRYRIKSGQNSSRNYTWTHKRK